MALEGRDTSEFRFSQWTSWVNLFVLVVTAIIGVLPDGSPWVMALGAAVAAANSLVSSSYAKSRAIAKAAQPPLGSTPPG